MTWNYRVIRRNSWHQIHEVYYDKDGKPTSVSKNGMCPHGETLKEVKQDLSYMEDAFSKPILNYEDF